MTNGETWQTGELDAAGGPDEEEILVADIEITRNELSGTISEIGNRLAPETIAAETRARVREATVGRFEDFKREAGQTMEQTRTGIVETIRTNPVPAAIAAVGVGWLVKRYREQEPERMAMNSWSGSRGNLRYADMYPGNYGSTVGNGNGNDGGPGVIQGAQERIGEALDGVTGTLADTAGRAGQVTSEMGRTAQDAVRNAEAGLGQGLETVRGQTSTAATQARDLFDRTLQENPLALGALALAAGAAAGMVIQETRKERELYAQPREQVMQAAAARVSEVLDQATSTAQEMTEQMAGNGGDSSRNAATSGNGPQSGTGGQSGTGEQSATSSGSGGSRSRSSASRSSSSTSGSRSTSMSGASTGSSSSSSTQGTAGGPS